VYTTKYFINPKNHHDKPWAAFVITLVSINKYSMLHVHTVHTYMSGVLYILYHKRLNATMHCPDLTCNFPIFCSIHTYFLWTGQLVRLLYVYNILTGVEP
jgi:hypothetical protein